MSQNDRTKRNTQDTQHTTATWTRRNERQRQLQQLERQRRRRAYSGASQTASSKHGRRRTERSRLGASVDGEARQETALLTVQPRRGTRRRSRPSHALSSYFSCSVSLATSCRVTSRRPPNNGTQHTARGSHGRPSRAQIVSTARSQ